MNIHNILHKLVVAVVMLIGFGIALGWPQYKKHQTISQARHALDLGREMAYQESVYKTSHGQYQPDFTQLQLSVSCPVTTVQEKPAMKCGDYVFYLQNGHIVRVDHENMPEWFELDIDGGTVRCSYEENSWAGKHICDRMDVSDLKL